MAEKIYEIAKGVSITSKGVIFDEGTEVTSNDFTSKEVFNKLVEAKKIVSVTSTKKEEKEEKKASSSTGAAEPESENTAPKKAEK